MGFLFWVENTPQVCDINSTILLLWGFHCYGECTQLNVRMYTLSDVTGSECVNEWLEKNFPSDTSWLRTSIKLLSSHSGSHDDQVKLYLCLHIFLTFCFHNKILRTEHYKMCVQSCSMKIYFMFQNKIKSTYIAWPTGYMLAANHHHCLWCT